MKTLGNLRRGKIAEYLRRDSDTHRSIKDRDMLPRATTVPLLLLSTVMEQLAGKAIVVSPEANGGDSSNVLQHLDRRVIRERPAVVHFNCGIHDTKKFKATGRFQGPPEQYEANLRKIVERIRKETGAVVLFATTTPILDDRAAHGEGPDRRGWCASPARGQGPARQNGGCIYQPEPPVPSTVSQPLDAVSRRSS